MSIIKKQTKISTMPKFKVTWRHEVFLEADTKEDAENLFRDLDLGQLNKAWMDGEITTHQRNMTKYLDLKTI